MAPDTINSAFSSEHEDDFAESVNSNATGDNHLDDIHIEDSIYTLKRLNDIHDKCYEDKEIFLNASNELLQHVEAISDGVPCDQQQYIDVANSLNVAVNAFSRSQRLYQEMNQIVVEQRKANNESLYAPPPSRRATKTSSASPWRPPWRSSRSSRTLSPQSRQTFG